MGAPCGTAGPPVRVEITHHAVERYRSRYAPQLSWDAADAELRTIVVHARSTKALSLQGHPIWESNGVRLVVKLDKGMRAHIVVTVLPPEGTDLTAEDIAHPRDETIAEPGGSRRAREWEIASAQRDLDAAKTERQRALEKYKKAHDALTACEQKLAIASNRLHELKDTHHG